MDENIRFSNVKMVNQGAKICTFTLEMKIRVAIKPKLLPWLRINRCALFEKNGKRWINLPQEQYEKDGEKKYFPYLDFLERPEKDELFSQVIQELEKWINTQPTQQFTPDPNLPF